MAEGISGQLYQFPPESYVDPCTICLGEREDRSLPNNCFHEFCFSCLLQWSKVKPVCPLCVQPFSSIIHNIKSDHEYDEQRVEILDPLLDFEYSMNYDEIDSSPDLILYNGRSIFDQLYNSEQPTSTSQVNVSHAPTRVFMVVGEELGMITRSGASSRPAVAESSSEDNLSTLHTPFTQQPVTSEQSLENLDSFPSSLQSDLASHDSGSSLPPRPSRIGRVSLAIDEGERIVDPPTFTGRGLHCEISNRPDPRPSAPTVGRRRTEEEGGNFESDEEEGVHFESEIDPDL
ncbi:uncharacterized protein LOC124316199 isoform X2 [Daphnia pulicaria]|uniref:uncharacterized protein LOC124316199 isoform X2 n=1 Tax=Daphnia pulicaria TaxID=35523 RepID=UPI001EEC0BBA|nr:uncharacterized protein LOC124316199 isoform X2 [Daphnia pulicaria]